MPTFEHNTLRQYKDQNGDIHLDYPITKAKNVVGLYGDAELTGVPTAPTAESGTNTRQIATTEFVQTELSDVKKSVSDGKTTVANAITEKGVETATDATFAVMAENIRKIESGGGELHGATIAVTTAEETLIGMTVTLSKEGVTVQNKPFDKNGICSFTDIQVIGDYTISSGNGEENTSEIISVTGDNIVNKTILHCVLSFILDGSVAMPLNDVATWLKCDSTGASNSVGYTELNQVLNDTTIIGNLTGDESAMQYLARSEDFADTLCNDKTFMTYLGMSPYVDDTVLNSDLWEQLICDSIYFESVLCDKVPTMTSNTEPSGECSASTVFTSGYEAYHAFSNNSADVWASSYNDSYDTMYLQYKFTKPISVKKFMLKQDRAGVNQAVHTVRVEASNDGRNYTKISDILNVKDGTTNNQYFTLNNDGYYLFYRVRILSAPTLSPNSVVCIDEVNFYGRSQQA